MTQTEDVFPRIRYKPNLTGGFNVVEVWCSFFSEMGCLTLVPPQSVKVLKCLSEKDHVTTILQFL